MDESVYRQVVNTSIAGPCSFEKSILTRCVACRIAYRHNVAEREIVACADAGSRDRCIVLHDTLRHSFMFALHRKEDDGPLTHAQEMRVQCGGLKGLQSVLDGSAEVGDVSDLVSRSMQAYGGIEDFPYSRVVHWATENYKYRGNAK